MRENDFVAVSMVRDLEVELSFTRERCLLLQENLKRLEHRYGLLWARAELAAGNLQQAIAEPHLESTKNLAALALNTLLGGSSCSEPAGELESHK